MSNVILIDNEDRLDLQTTLVDVEAVDSLEQATNDQATYLLNSDNAELTSTGSKFFISAESFHEKWVQENVHVYFDLELYPFFQKAKEVIQKSSKPKGVCRLRRTSEHRSEQCIVSDLFVLSTLFGTPEHVFVKRTNPEVNPFHVIVTVNFGGGTMAHLDYTFAGEEYVEFEWSGNDSIIEFNSHEMNPIRPQKYLEQPLTYNVESILEHAHEVSDELVERLTVLQKQVLGGANE